MDEHSIHWLNYWDLQTKKIGDTKYTTVHVAYEIDDEDDVRFPVIHEDLAYYLDDNGIAIDYELSPRERELVCNEIIQDYY